MTLWQTHFFTCKLYSLNKYSYSIGNNKNRYRYHAIRKSLLDKQSTVGKSLLQRIGSSFSDSIRDIVFGMEDGTVSIFGLVFGVASSANSSSVVLLAGATGAISAAVSMMAGTFLDVESTNDQAKAQLAQEQRELETLGIAAAAAAASFLIGKLVNL